MELFQWKNPGQIGLMAEALFREERATKGVLNGWFLSREIAADTTEGKQLDQETKAAAELEAVIASMPLEISEHAIFAGTQRDAFAASYALINPAFQVETFKGYCDPLEVYDYATPTEEIPAQRIAAMRERASRSDYVRDLNAVYRDCEEYTEEVAFFVEQVTGHLIPDFRPAMKEGVLPLIARIEERLEKETLEEERRQALAAMKRGLKCALVLAERYRALALEQLETAQDQRKQELQLIADTLNRVPREGARNLYEAMQSYLLLWQTMCIRWATAIRSTWAVLC